MSFQPTSSSERSYARDILGIARKLFEGGDWFTGTLLSVPEWLDMYAKQAAERMITHQMYENAKSWREAARKAGKGQYIFSALQNELRAPVGRRYRELITENAQYIKTLPQSAAAMAVKQYAEVAQEGRRAKPEGILAHVLRYQAQRIARTEIAKAQSALTQARSEQLGLDWYVWQTSEDARVRYSHRKMQGILFRFDDPPSPEKLVGERSVGFYNAGNIFNCRCYMEPLLRFMQVSWPHRCYVQGAIRSLTLTDFRKLNQYASVVA